MPDTSQAKLDPPHAATLYNKLFAGPAVKSAAAPSTTSRRSLSSRFIALVFGIMLLAASGWFAWVFSQIRFYSTHDEAQPADAIAVFGAAEYVGRPSPVLRARLDHALDLYRRGLAPLIITLGGQGDAYHSEGSVGRDYLVARGVPSANIIAETESNNTEASATDLATITQTNHLDRIIVVSDPTHLFRIRALCQSKGLRVFTSPRVNLRVIPRSRRMQRVTHEMFSYTLWRIGL